MLSQHKGPKLSPLEEKRTIKKQKTSAFALKARPTILEEEEEKEEHTFLKR